jgi:hypothetical protein
MTKVIISTWKPWSNTAISLQERVDQVKVAQAEICLKGSNSKYLYGPDTWGIFKIYPWKGKSNDDLERLCKEQGVKVQLWDFPYLQYPQGSADAVNESIARWNPTDVDLDVEGRYAKNYPYNTGAFLRGLGRVKVRFWLQSYRRPDLHREIRWEKWLKYKDETGKYIIHGLAPQAYPIWSEDWPADFKRMIDEYMKILEPIGRVDMPWLPTLPTFSEHGWTPKVDDLIHGCDYLKERLGDRLVGFNFWRQGFLFKTEFQPILSYINTLYEPEEPIEPIRNDWYTEVDSIAKAAGWNITKLIPPEAHSHEG